MTLKQLAITCIHCQKSFELTEALTDQIRGNMQEELTANFEQKLLEEKAAYDKRLTDEKTKMWVIAQQKAKEKADTELKDLHEQAAERAKQLEEAQKNELELRKQAREMEAKTKNMQLDMERKMDEERKVITDKIHKDVEEQQKRKDMEAEQKMEQMRKTIEELRRKSEQGSMQLQGDAQEANLKATLEAAFPMDSVADVPTGIRGGDLVQTVRSEFGQDAGVILWESKNTKNWNAEWLKKLKGDQLLVKADICIIATTVLPEGIKNFGCIDGVWVVDYTCSIAFAASIRFHLAEMARMQRSLVGRDEKMEHLYAYLSGSQFKSRVENIVSAFRSMKDDLEAEKRAFMRLWSKREREIERVITNTTGMYGDLQGIIGASLPTIAHLELEFSEEVELPL